MADTTNVKTGKADEGKAGGADELKGRLLLATGRLVSVEAEGCHASTEHHDDELGAAVPVLRSFIVA